MPAVNTSASAPVYPIKCACDGMQLRCDEPSKDYCTTNYTCFVARVREDDGEDVLTMGCIGELERAELNCHVGSKSFVAIKCCNRGDYCNRRLVPQYTTDVVPNQSAAIAVSSGGHPTLQQTLYGLAGLTLLLLVASLVTWRVVRFRSRRKSSSASSSPSFGAKSHLVTNHHAHGIDLRVTPMGDSTLKGLCEQSCTSGSGSGVPLLAQRTVASSIDLHEIIGKGRYGQVYRGVYQGESVAVKVFCSHAEATWWRECAIYSTVMLRHENILAFVAADTVSRTASSTQLWLVTRYHEHGSLYDYLSRHTAGASPIAGCADMLRLLVSAAAGLAHLHTEIIGTQGKPAIAHRDVKSRNILVMSDRRCCIADLGLAVLQRPPQQGIAAPGGPGAVAAADELKLAAANLRVGTKRYMAPEVLSETLNVNSFDSYRQADVYAFALVIWETARRCPVGGVAEEYQPPYYDQVSSDPSFDDMHRIVCTSQQRPSIPNRWTNDQLMQSVAHLIKECWRANPNARLTMLRVKKTLSKMLKSIDSTQSQPPHAKV